jgi:hypothetical protein
MCYRRVLQMQMDYTVSYFTYNLQNFYLIDPIIDPHIRSLLDQIEKGTTFKYYISLAFTWA